MLEYFVHLDPDDPPDDLVLATAEVPTDLLRDHVDDRELPPNWQETPAPPELARFGDEFVQRSTSCLLVVPSVLARSENNWLLNPEHLDFHKIVVGGTELLSYDARMFAGKKRRSKHKAK
jgi:RES domain-containing protein